MDGDQIIIKFEYDQEKWAFESAIKKLKTFVDAMDRKTSTSNIDVEELKSLKKITATNKKGTLPLTTLEYTVILANQTDVSRIIGADIFLDGRKYVHLSKFVEEKK
jgi:hypothetical protein